MRKKRVLLTGASGTVGKETFKELLKKADEYDISLFLRESRKNKKLFKPYYGKVKIFWGTLQNYEEVKEAVNGQEVVIHMAAALPDVAFKKPELVVSTNVDGTQNVLKAMLSQQNHPKIIYTSSVQVYGDRRKNPIIKISDPIKHNSEDVYGSTKIKAEELIKNSKLEYCIFRVSYVTSTNIIKLRPIMFFIALDTKVEIIDAKDVGLALINAIDSNKIWNKIFNLGGGKKCQIEFKDNLNDMFEIMGFGKNFLPDEAFSKNHSHCGFFDAQEMGEIQNILGFQRFSLEDFYEEVKQWIGIKRHLIPLVKPILRWYILRKSEFYKEYKRNKIKNKN